MSKLRLRSVVYLLIFAALAAALWYGRTRAAPDLATHASIIFPGAHSFDPTAGLLRAHDASGATIGWVGSGRSSGYGGPMVILVGIDTAGTIAGASVVEQRETPIFWRMVRSADFFETLVGESFEAVDYDYERAVARTGATISSDAIVASVRASVARVAQGAFDVDMPTQRRPFEFGVLEIVVLALFAAAIVVHRSGGPMRRRARWALQITGLLVLGFWKDSPITLSKITALLAGFFPDPRTNLALYLLILGFVLTSFLFGRNLYCLYACPFGAAQRCLGVIGGKSLKLPLWSIRLMGTMRNVVVVAAVVVAFAKLTPVLATFEPFAVLFSLKGTTLQWLLLFLVLVASLLVSTPWCNFLCPMRSVEVALHDMKSLYRQIRGKTDER